MSNSGYDFGNQTDDSESVTFAPVDNGEITSDPFQTNTNESTEMDEAPFAFAASSQPESNGSGGSVGSVSLLERIQQQKKQQQVNTTAAAPALASGYAPTPAADPSTGSASSAQQDPLNPMQFGSLAESQPGYPVLEDTTYYTSSAPAPDASGNIQMNIPDYAAAASRPDPYASSYNSDFKDNLFSALSTIGSAAGTAAKSAYRGSRRLYGNMMNKRSSSGMAGQDRMSMAEMEMDYQRQSLLMDPHDMEDSAMPSTNLGGSSSTPMGLRATNSTVTTEGYSMMGYAKQFCVDMKDIYLGLSRRMQIAVLVFLIFVIWLFISEEERHHENPV